jgi:cytoskeletal protein CcmA (bactofilin family)
MWNKRGNVAGDQDAALSSDPPRPAPAMPSPEPARPKAAAANEGMIGKGVVVKGDLTGSDPIFVDGHVEGVIHIPGQRVTVGKNGTVVGRTGNGDPCISAGEIVILGTVTGDVAALDRVDIRADGSLTGNITTARLSIEDGAYFRGGIDIRREEPETVPAPAQLELVQPI